MPEQGGRFRAEELALISRLEHERACNPRLGEALAACETDSDLLGDEEVAANLREIRRDYDRRCRLPADLVAEISETSSRALEAWKQARRGSDFGLFRPWLEKQIDLARRKAECYGSPPGGDLYDALLQEYESELTGSTLERIFAPLRHELTALIGAVERSPERPDQTLHQRKLPVESQRGFNLWVLQQLGFDTDAGRLDVSAHPFSSGLAPGDTRLTTRYREGGFADGLGSTMHEAGHALYEQGLPKDRVYGQPLGEAASLGIHESQSRLWENHVGRSSEFWEWALPEAARFFDGALDGITAEQAYAAANMVTPHLIRVESDEATYNLHIMLRFDLERAMVRGELQVADLPGEWNDRMQRDLGLQVPDDSRGCLQDIHWALGSVGYFPSYTLGNLYAAQLWETIAVQLPGLPQQIRRGEFGALLGWLRDNVHAHGRHWSAPELCQRITGKPLEHAPLLRHLQTKLRTIYDI